jgi:hypothetical protein
MVKLGIPGIRLDHATRPPGGVTAFLGTGTEARSVNR